MSYYTRLMGRIGIEPPLTFGELAKLSTERWRTLEVAQSRQEEWTDTGMLVVIMGEAVLPQSSEVNYDTAEEELRALVKAFPNRTYPGYLMGAGEEPGDVWRLVVRDGTVHRLEPKWED